MKNLFVFILALIFAGPVMAQEETVTPQAAIAMHGTPKYPADFKNLEYVNPDAPKGGTLRLSSEGTFDSLNAFIIKGTPAAGLSYLGTDMIYESLMDQSYDEPFSMYGILAESIELPESRAWVAFNIRPQAKWADGKPVTADDVVWSFNALMEKGTPFFKAYYADVEKVETTSPSRVKFTFKHAGNMELPLVISQIMILPKHYWTTEGRDIGATTLTPPLGSGPYKIGTVAAGRSIEYVRDPNWWGKDLPFNKGRYNFDRVTYDYYKDGNVALEAFFAGEYDVRQENVAKLWATAYDAPAVKDGRIVKGEIENERPQGIQGWLYNIRRPQFADSKVREALAYAFDFEWSNKQFAYGSYKRSRSYFSNSDLESSGLPQGRELEILEKYRDKLPPEVFTQTYEPPKTDGTGNNRANLKKAAELLDQAGFKIGKDGVRANDKGVRLEFEFIDSNPMFERWTLPFIKNLEKIGVKATYRVIDPAQYQNRMNEFDYDITAIPIPQSDSPGNEQLDFWGSAKAKTPGSRNYIGIESPVVDELIDMIIRAKSREELVATTHALDRVLQWGYYVIPQWHMNTWRIAWWNHLQKPEKLSPLTPGISDTWWNKAP